jgi:hypothetical protein
MISGLGTILTVISLIVVLVPLLVGGVFVILIVANRADPDPTGRRPVMVYSYAISFIGLFVTLFATFSIVVNLVSLIGSHHSSPSLSDLGGVGGLGLVSGQSGSQHPVGDAAARGIVMGALLAAIAGFAYLVHARSADRATSGVPAVEPSGRVRSSYIAAVSFVCVVILVVSAVVATYQVFRILGPGVFSSDGSGSRVAALRTMLPLIYLALASAWLLRRHLRQVPPDSRPLLAWPGGGQPGGAAAAPTTPAETAPIAVEVEVLEAAPPPRKRAPRRQPPKKS